MNTLNSQQIELIAKVVIEHLEKEKKKQQELKKDYRLHNIKLLLKHYRSLLLHCELIKGKLETFNDTSIQELDIEEITLEAIESIKRSKEKSLIMVAFIQEKIEAYKKTCTDDEMKYFRVLEKMYLTERKWNIIDIAEFENIDRATVYRYIDRAINDLSVIVFGVDVIDFLT